ncbi:hypothetical protein [Actinomadura sp. B10D3]|uniref:hypothetical protein n=1 Tax=Actinomadura sp. B10D3 TaxID=3153557 RepID=UPI00325E0BC5
MLPGVPPNIVPANADQPGTVTERDAVMLARREFLKPASMSSLCAATLPALAGPASADAEGGVVGVINVGLDEATHNSRECAYNARHERKLQYVGNDVATLL